jgi:hypothetical protein
VTELEYKARIRGLGLTPHGRSSGSHTLHRWRDGLLYPIRDPDTLTALQRFDTITRYEIEFA